MSDAKWFIQLHGQIQGPLNQSDFENTVSGLNDEIAHSAMVWRKGFSQWVKANEWTIEDQRNSLLGAKSGVSKPAEQDGDGDLFEKTFGQSFTEGEFYRVQLNYVDQPLMSKEELLTFIAKQPDVSAISIQDPKSKEWKEVYVFADIVEKLGLSRRKQARVPILAQFAGKSNKSEDVSYRVITISQGGMGFTENFDLQIGDEVEGQISSPHFFQPVQVKAEVIYAGQDGYVGLKFSQLTDEAKTAIIDYIKKFGKNSANTP
ncbi:PilZ domain-containing protein [Pseudobdellovibrio exovorus]|uniref:Uncharacterized protein n=1 Tax=Pseudobdellovibrio exovorus JSS TaxID=1184267 RepID=M4VC02_9BACT|nr:PilZ domain-containing protein [Pseudobdellovibrio exovorus]AGH95546.1 hypothetical protein A11Q_1330 [Pseudobdellovibrio exovorus JSS]